MDFWRSAAAAVSHPEGKRCLDSRRAASVICHGLITHNVRLVCIKNRRQTKQTHECALLLIFLQILLYFDWHLFLDSPMALQWKLAQMRVMSDGKKVIESQPSDVTRPLSLHTQPRPFFFFLMLSKHLCWVFWNNQSWTGFLKTYQA